MQHQHCHMQTCTHVTGSAHAAAGQGSTWALDAGSHSSLGQSSPQGLVQGPIQVLPGLQPLLSALLPLLLLLCCRHSGACCISCRLGLPALPLLLWRSGCSCGGLSLWLCSCRCCRASALPGGTRSPVLLRLGQPPWLLLSCLLAASSHVLCRDGCCAGVRLLVIRACVAAGHDSVSTRSGCGGAV